MKKIVFFTNWTPTEENVGPSAHLYHLLKNRPEDYQLIVLTLNENKISQEDILHIQTELKCKFVILRQSLLSRVITSHRLYPILDLFRATHFHKMAYYKLDKRIVNFLNNENPDLIWIYPYYFLSVSKQLKKYKQLLTGPDCSSLHYSRLLNDSFSYRNNEYRTYLKSFLKEIETEKEWGKSPHKIHVVGIEDERFFKQLTNKSDIHFFPHPYFNCVDREITFNSLKLRILIAGKYDMYTYTAANELIKVLTNTKLLQVKYSITFLGKGWDDLNQQLYKSGYESRHITWVEKYVEELCNYDIEFFPISVGTGTKGKVLDALNTGLLCIGTEYAFENIYVKNGHSCILYKYENEVVEKLLNIYSERDKYKSIAINGKKMVRHYHEPAAITKNILEYCFTDEYNINIVELVTQEFELL